MTQHYAMAPRVCLCFKTGLAGTLGDYSGKYIYSRGDCVSFRRILSAPPSLTLHESTIKLSSVPMSTSGHPTKDAPASNLCLILDEASAHYKELTGHDLATHPFAAKFNNWDSADIVLEVFQDQARKFNEFRKGNKKLMEWLKPTVQVLVSISSSLGNALSTVIFIPSTSLCSNTRVTAIPARTSSIYWH